MWELRKGTCAVLTDEGGAILDERTGRWTHLTPTAAAVVMLLCAGCALEEAAADFARRYQIPAEQAARDVGAVADALAAAGLVAVRPQRRRAWRRWRR
jgi:hypothetical protein